MTYKLNGSFFLICAVYMLFAGAASQADNLQKDVQNIKAAHAQQKVLRCVLNQRPRCLAINLGPKLSVAYDTCKGALCFAWSPEDPKQPLKLDGAVFTGRHGPQPTTKGKLIFEHKGGQYSCSDASAELRYLGHSTDQRGHIVVKFAFQKTDGKKLAIIEEKVVATSNGKDRLHRRVTVSELAKGVSITVNFPKELQWKNTVQHSSTMKVNGTKTYSADLNL